MLKITEKGMEGTPPDRLGTIKSTPIIGKLALRFTRWQRAINAEKYTDNGDIHLDIGCGDGYFLLRSPYKERYGFDFLMGEDDRIDDKLDFEDESVDLVTMLAVIEHLHNVEQMLGEIHRVLKPGGKLVLTTPKEAAELLIKLYVKNIDDVHETYFDLSSMREISKNLFDVTGYHTFIFGLNQAFCLTKIDPKN
jgi:SAM-dependent methyltransferase